MADRNTNLQYANSNEYFKDANGMEWGKLLSTHDDDGFTVVKVFNPTAGSGHCYSKGGPAAWHTVINGDVVGREPSTRRATLIGHAVGGGHIKNDGDTGGRLDSYLFGMAVWNYEGPAPTEMQQREINALLKD